MIIIRPAKLADVKYLQKLNNEVFVDNTKYDSDLEVGWSLSDAGKEYYTSLLGDENSICLVAEDDGQAIGYLAGGPKEEIGRKSRYFEVNDMGVNPEHRSKGIGKKLLDECFKVAKSKGFNKAFVRVYFTNKKAIEFYKKSGFGEIELGLEKLL